MGQYKPVLKFDVYGVHQRSKVHQQDFGSFSPAHLDSNLLDFLLRLWLILVTLYCHKLLIVAVQLSSPLQGHTEQYVLPINKGGWIVTRVVHVS